MRRDPSVKIEQTIRNKLANYLAKEMSLRAFWQWFVPAVWDIDHRSPPYLRELVYGIKARVDDYGDGRITESQLRAALLPFASSINLAVEETSRSSLQHRQEASTSSTIIKLPLSPPKRVLACSYMKCEVASAL